jgi:hypothetical protein
MIGVGVLDGKVVFKVDQDFGEVLTIPMTIEEVTLLGKLLGIAGNVAERGLDPSKVEILATTVVLS